MKLIRTFALMALLCLPGSVLAQYYTLQVDTQNPTEAEDIPRQYGANTLFLKFVVTDSGSAVNFTNWTLYFKYGYSQFDTNGMVTCDTSISGNTVTIVDTNNLVAGSYYWSLFGTNTSEYAKTWATGQMHVEYDPAAGTDLALTLTQSIDFDRYTESGLISGVTVSNGTFYGDGAGLTNLTGSISDGDKGDITVSGAGTNWQFNAGSVTTTEVLDGTIAPADLDRAYVSNVAASVWIDASNGVRTIYSDVQTAIAALNDGDTLVSRGLHDVSEWAGWGNNPANQLVVTGLTDVAIIGYGSEWHSATNGNLLTVVNSTNLTIQGLTLSGDGDQTWGGILPSATPGVLIYALLLFDGDAKDIDVIDCRFLDGRNHGIRALSQWDANANNPTDVRIKNSWFQNIGTTNLVGSLAAGDGTAVADMGNGWIVQGCTFYDVRRGIEPYGGHSATELHGIVVSDNVFDGIWSHGIVTYASTTSGALQDFSIIGNTFRDRGNKAGYGTSDDAIHITAGVRVSIVGNSIVNPIGNAIDMYIDNVQGSKDFLIADNNIVSTGSGGVPIRIYSLNGPAHGTISGNRIAANNNGAIYVGDEGVIVTGNYGEELGTSALVSVRYQTTNGYPTVIANNVAHTTNAAARVVEMLAAAADVVVGPNTLLGTSTTYSSDAGSNPNLVSVVGTNWTFPGDLDFSGTATGDGSGLTAVDAATGDSATGFFDAGTLELARGGTGQSLADPNADGIFLWDDSDTGSEINFAAIGSGLSFDGTTLTATGSSGLGANLASTSNDILSDTGSIQLGGAGNTNNEKLTFDFETTADIVDITTSTGVTLFDLSDFDIRLPAAGGDQLQFGGPTYSVGRVGTRILTLVNNVNELKSDTSGATLRSAGRFGWTSGGSADAAQDTSIRRASAGLVVIDDDLIVEDSLTVTGLLTAADITISGTLSATNATMSVSNVQAQVGTYTTLTGTNTYANLFADISNTGAYWQADADSLDIRVPSGDVLDVIINATPTFQVNASGTTVAGTGAYQGKIKWAPPVYILSTNRTWTADELTGNAKVYITGASTQTLPAVHSLLDCIFVADAAVVVTVRPNASDGIRMDATTDADGDGVVSSGTADDAIAFGYYSSAAVRALSDGNWTAE